MKPILFNADMTQAAKSDRKTATRRVLKPQPKYAAMTAAGLLTSDNPISINNGLMVTEFGSVTTWDKMPYRPGEILYVPEPWRCTLDSQLWGDGEYRVVFPDGEVVSFCFVEQDRLEKWKKYIDKPAEHWQSPYFMPREAARIFLRVSRVRVERLQDMTTADMVSEGMDVQEAIHSPWKWHELWNSTLKPELIEVFGWKANPWVYAIEFKRIPKEEALHGGVR